jgi:membrane protein DedA with SNARE-associated domain
LDPDHEQDAAEHPGGAGAGEPADHAPARQKPSRLKLSLVVVPLVGLVIASYVGDGLAPSLIANAKDGGNGGLWLISLNARNRNLILATNYLEWFEYYPVAFVRLLISDPLFYLLGWWYGDAAVRWMEKRTRTFGSMVRTAQGWFGKAAAPLVVLAPNNFICLFAGSAGMRPVTFLFLNVVGTIGRLFLVRWLGAELTAPIDWLVDFIREYRWPLTALSVAFVGFTVWQETRVGESELESLLNLEDELEAEEEQLEAEARHDRNGDGGGEAGNAGEPPTGPVGTGPP